MTKSTSKLFEDSAVVDTTGTEIMNPPVSEEKTATEVVNNAPDDIVDIDLDVVKKKRFRFNKDNSKILELNTSDVSIVTRLSTAYDELTKLMEEVGDTLSKLPDEGDEEVNASQLEQVSDILKKLDSQMRKQMDYIFDAPVSEVCASEGSMYDPIDGSFRYEHILEKLTSLYENNLNSEFSKMKKRVSAKTSKYTKKFHN